MVQLVCACVRYQSIEKDVIMLKKKVSELPFHMQVREIKFL